MSLTHNPIAAIGGCLFRIRWRYYTDFSGIKETYYFYHAHARNLNWFEIHNYGPVCFLKFDEVPMRSLRDRETHLSCKRSVIILEIEPLNLEIPAPEWLPKPEGPPFEGLKEPPRPPEEFPQRMNRTIRGI